MSTARAGRPGRPFAASRACFRRPAHARPAPTGRLDVVAGAAADLPPPTVLAGAVQAAATLRSRSQASTENTWTLEEAIADHHGSDKELGRRHMRGLATFTFQRWAFHRSTDRYARHMLGIFQSRIVRGLALPLASAGTTAFLVCAYEEALRQGVLPASLPTFLLPSLPFDITSFALSLLLVFRTNTSYDRWQLALTSWGQIATRSRDSLRQLLAYTAAGPDGAPPPGAAPAKLLSAAATGRWLVAFARALKAQLTQDSDLRAELKGILTASELDLLCSAYHPPSFALSVLTELTAAAPLRDSQRVRLDENLTFFEDAMGSCERILRTPIPLSYTRHTSRFMVIWLSCLPLGMWQACGWGTVPLTVVISFLLLGIEEIGVAIEEPFSILPLDELCQEVEVGLSDIVDQATSTKRAAKEAVSAAAAAAITAAAVAASAPSGGERSRCGNSSSGGSGSSGSGGSGSSGSGSSGSGSGGSSGGGAAQAAAPAAPAAAAAVANAVAPLLPGALGLASLSRERIPVPALDPRAIFNSLDDGDLDY